jgi:hypothetical protein
MDPLKQQATNRGGFQEPDHFLQNRTSIHPVRRSLTHVNDQNADLGEESKDKECEAPNMAYSAYAKNV